MTSSVEASELIAVGFFLSLRFDILVVEYVLRQKCMNEEVELNRVLSVNGECSDIPFNLHWLIGSSTGVRPTALSP